MAIVNYSGYTDTTLHTNYYYIRENALEKMRQSKKTSPDSEIVLNSKLTLDRKKENLAKVERSFYMSWGCKNEEEFFELFKMLNKISPADKKALRSFTNYGASNFINKIIGNKSLKTKPVDQEVTLTINTANLNHSLNKTFRDYFHINNKDIKMNGSFDIKFAPSPKAFKIIFNALKETRFQVNSFNSNKLLEDFDDLADGFDFVIDGEVANTNTLKGMIPVLPFPWAYTSEEIEKMIKDDPSREEEIAKEIERQIIQPLKDYCKYDSTSLNFKTAFYETLEELGIVGSNSLSMFLGGRNWENTIKGAMGEAGNKILFIYIQKISKKISNLSIKLVGNELNSFQEKRGIDLLVNGFGVQVKNYLLDKEGNNITQNAITVRQHPTELGQYLNDSEAQSFYGFIANYFFNPVAKSVWSGDPINDLKQFIANNLQAEVLRLATDSVEDAVVFYNISNTYLIPGSAILEYYSQQQENRPTVGVSISSSIKPYGDGVSRTENKYWTKEGQEGARYWAPTELNKSEFINAIRKNITIEARMNTLIEGAFEKYKLPI